VGGWSALAREPVSAGTGAGARRKPQEVSERSAWPQVGGKFLSALRAGLSWSRVPTQPRKRTQPAARDTEDNGVGSIRVRPPGAAALIPGRFFRHSSWCSASCGWRPGSPVIGSCGCTSSSDRNSLGEGTSGLGPAADPPPGRSVRSTAIIEPLYRWPQRGIIGASPAHGTRSGRQPGEA